MSFQDIFKSSFLENINSVSFLDMGISMVLAFGIGLFIFLIYKKTFAGVMYSSSFGVTLVALTMIATLVILAVTSNIVLSLGMVGALSIVRFRTAIKEPLDIAFLFWSIAAGIVLAAGLIPLAVLSSESFCCSLPIRNPTAIPLSWFFAARTAAAKRPPPSSCARKPAALPSRARQFRTVSLS